MPSFGAQIDTRRIPIKGVVFEQGTAFPNDPVEGLHFHRTDLREIYAFLAGDWRRVDTQGLITLAYLNGRLGTKSDTGHTHDDRYYTEAEVDAKIGAVTIPSATTGAEGKVRLATPAEATTGLSGSIAVTPQGLKAAFDALVNGAPGALDQLNELAAAMGNDPNLRQNLINMIAGKADAGHTHVIGTIDGLEPRLISIETAMADKTSVWTRLMPAMNAGTWVEIPAVTVKGAPSISFYDLAREEIILDTRYDQSTGQCYGRTGFNAAANTLFGVVVGAPK